MSGRFYDLADWKKIAKAQLAREPMCEACEVQPATAVDHIIPIAKGGAKRDRANLQSLCVSCHSEKTNCDKTGRKFVPYKYQGCFDDGSPRDPEHPWFTGGGPSIAGSSRCTTGVGPIKIVSFPKRK